MSPQYTTQKLPPPHDILFCFEINCRHALKNYGLSIRFLFGSDPRFSINLINGNDIATNMIAAMRYVMYTQIVKFDFDVFISSISLKITFIYVKRQHKIKIYAKV